jgi:hypothetical protein
MKTKSLLDRSFRYTPSFETNLKSTFARVRREMAQQKTREAETTRNVLPLEQNKARPASWRRARP